MGVVLVLMVFLYPLGMPIITLASYVALLILKRGQATAVFVFGLPVTGVLVLVLGPSIVRTGAGSFALPWWLQQSGATEYYVWQYALACLALLLLFTLGVTIYRILVPLPLPQSPDSQLASQNTAEILAAIKSFRAGNPVSQRCVICNSPISIESAPSAKGQPVVLHVSCSCKQCNGRLSL